MPQIIITPKFQAIDSAGAPLSGGKLYTYSAGTSIDKATYTTSACGTANANPVVLDSRGEATIYGKGYYKLVLKTSADVTIWTQDNVAGMGYWPVEGTFQCDYSEADQGVTGGGNSLKDLVDAIAAEGATILFQHNSGGATTSYVLATSITVPANITLEFERGAQISISAGKTLTINGVIDALDQVCFTSTGTVAGSPKNDLTHSAWFDTGVTDSSTPIGVLKKIGASNAQGDIFYHNGTSIIRLAAGTRGHFLSTKGASLNPAWLRGPGIRDKARGLVIVCNSTHPTYQVDVDADEIIVEDTNSIALHLIGINLTIDVTAAGANGLDTGSEDISTWYYIWVIYNPTTDTIAGLLSESSTAPTLPADYTFKACVGAVHNGASPGIGTLTTGDFNPFYQVGDELLIDNAWKIVDNGGGTTTLTLDLSACVPLNVKRIKARIIAAALLTFYASHIDFDDSLAFDNTQVPVALKCDAANASATFEMMLKTAQSMYYQTSASTVDMWITGWVIK